MGLRVAVALGFFALTAACPSPECTSGDCGGGTGGGSGGGGGFGGGAGASSGTNTISGTATYEFVPSFYDPVADTGTLRFTASETRPIRNAVVFVKQGNSMQTEVTDEQGRFSVKYTPGSGELTLGVIARTANPQIQVEDNTDNDTPWAVGGTFTASETTKNIHAASGWTGSSYNNSARAAAPFAILDSMYTASKAFLAVRNVPFPPLRVNWSPNNVPEALANGDKTTGRIGTSHYAPDENEIYVLGKDGVDTDEFDSHVIVHEWGHYFEKNLSRSDSPGGRHGPGDVLDPRIAFGEAWGNAVASMVLPETVYADTSWANGTVGAFGFDTETVPTPTDDPMPSAFSESSVLRILFDLYDTPSDGAFDQVAVGLGPIYDVMTGFERTTPSMTTLASFVTGLKAQSGVNGAAVNTLLANYNVGPISTEWGDGDPGLAGMYSGIDVPGTQSISLGGGNLPNTWQQNQYYVFTGNGSPITVTTQSSEDVDIVGYASGVQVGSSATTGGDERFTFNSQSGVVYVVVLTGFGQNPGDYAVSVSTSSP